ncbi:MAG: FAD-dependent oxidoreductase, partial [Eubacteriales bacterium]|nr:FAD-dependent oxidoreductase [Eubacteriales bacterium]
MANKTILVVGGGISGLSAALEAAEAGREVVLVEKNPYLGGR